MKPSPLPDETYGMEYLPPRDGPTEFKAVPRTLVRMDRKTIGFIAGFVIAFGLVGMRGEANARAGRDQTQTVKDTMIEFMRTTKTRQDRQAEAIKALHEENEQLRKNRR